MVLPTPEEMKVKNFKELEERIAKMENVGSRLKDHKDEIIKLIGDEHEDFLEGAKERFKKMHEFKGRVEKAKGNDAEIKKLIEEWNAKVDDRHEMFEKMAKIKETINAKYPGGFDAFKAKMEKK